MADNSPVSDRLLIVTGFPFTVANCMCRFYSIPVPPVHGPLNFQWMKHIGGGGRLLKMDTRTEDPSSRTNLLQSTKLQHQNIWDQFLCEIADAG
jgi:hypothetical protein